MMWAFYFQNISLMGAGRDNDLNEKKWLLSVIFDQMDGYSEMSTSRARRFQALNQRITTYSMIDQSEQPLFTQPPPVHP